MGTSNISESDSSWTNYNEFHFNCDKRRFQKFFARVDLFRMIQDVPGDIVDAGAFKGVSTLQFAHLLEAYLPNTRTKVISFDTFDSKFEHLRPHEQRGADDLMKDYRVDAYENLLGVLKKQELQNRVTIVKGDILETLPNYIENNPGFRINFLHCDLDAYKPTIATLKAAWPRITPGGIVVLDEYAIEKWGESDAADEFLKSVSPSPQIKMLPNSPTPSAYFRKI